MECIKTRHYETRSSRNFPLRKKTSIPHFAKCHDTSLGAPRFCAICGPYRGGRRPLKAPRSEQRAIPAARAARVADWIQNKARLSQTALSESVLRNGLEELCAWCGYDTRLQSNRSQRVSLRRLKLSLKYAAQRVAPRIIFQGEVQTRRNGLWRPL